MLKNKYISFTIGVFVFALLNTSATAKEILVSSQSDTGAGSFREAIRAANNDASVSDIRFEGIKSVFLKSTLIYSGTQSIAIHGSGVIIDGAQMSDGDLFLSKSSAPLRMENMAFKNSKGNGIAIHVPKNSESNAALSLNQVKVSDTDLYGLYMTDSVSTDQKLATVADTGMILYIRHSHFSNNAIHTNDRNAIRVDEHGKGGIYSDIAHTVIEGNQGDGIELNENGKGDVILSMKNTIINGDISSSFISVKASENRKKAGQL